MRIVIQTRFSFLGLSGWRLPDPALILAPERLNLRLQYFENIMLRSLQDQLDGDFELMILTSDILPDHYKSRLEDLATKALGKDRVDILYRPHGSAGQNFQDRIRETMSDMDPVAQVVLDDDDALSRSYIQNLRYESESFSKYRLKSAYDFAFYTFPRGIAYWNWKGEKKLTYMHLPFTNLGLALVSLPTQRRQPFMSKHLKLGQESVTRIVDDQEPYYMRSLHDFNDSRRLHAAELELEWRDFKIAIHKIPVIGDLFPEKLSGRLAHYMKNLRENNDAPLEAGIEDGNDQAPMDT